MVMETDISAATRWFRQRLAGLFGASHNGRRDYNLEFGYPEKVSTEDLWQMYQRNGIASRIIRAFPAATWEEQPVIRDMKGDSEEKKKSDGKENDAYSPFVASVNDFFRRTNALRYLERADRLSGIGHYGILVMGFKDGRPLTEPLATGKKELLYLAGYSEMAAKIADYVRDTQDPRYGMPLKYNVSPLQDSGETSGPVPASFVIHSSRVIHISEFLDNGDIAGTPRLTPVYNDLLDLRKVVGSSAETFWRNSNPGLALSADADAKISPEMLKDMKDQASEFEDGMRRILAMQGITATSLGAGNTTADPATNINALLDLIAGAVGMPKRILIGSERGELASSQDSDSWASRIDERQNSFATPSVLSPFVQKMIDTGNIVTPQERFWIEWPDSNALSPKDQADVQEKRARTLTTYANAPNAAMIVPEPEFRRDFLGLDPESEYEIEELEDLPEDEAGASDGLDGNPAVDDTEQDGKEVTINRRRLRANATPRTLYVRRDLLNAAEVRDWYKTQGIGDMTDASEMHVTIAYSRAPVDWMKVGSDYTSDPEGNLRVIPGGARLHELFGKDKATLVLLFNNAYLSWRHEDIKAAGASYDFPDYQPHVSLSYNWQKDLTRIERENDKGSLAALEPYVGELIFGPEIFEELQDDWKSGIKENALRRIPEVRGVKRDVDA